jgi:beta-glucosidase
MVSVVDGIRAKVGPGVKVEWAMGARFTDERAFPPIQGSVFRGLRGEYFDNEEFRGTPKLVRNDLQLAFDWAQGSPDPAIPNDHYSIRWTGKVVPERSGDYTLSLRADDGVRLWIDGRKLIDDWSVHPAKATEAKLHVQAGVPLDLKLEYYEQAGEASLQLGWAEDAAKAPELDQAVELAQRSDVTVFVAGIVEGEAQDRAHLDLPGRQEELIRLLAATGKPVVVVLLAGSPVTMEGWIDRVPALLNAWYPGQEGGTAIADVLFGDVNPGGRLPITFPRDVAQCPIYYNSAPSGRGYDYVNLTGKPRFPFGYGLSYTTFAYSNLLVTPTSSGRNQPVTVTFEIQNTGAVEGDEVAQLYLHQTVSSIVRPMKELKDFARVHLAPGERKRVTFTLPPDALAIWNERMKRVVEPGRFDVMVGSSSEDIRLRGAFNVR